MKTIIHMLLRSGFKKLTPVHMPTTPGLNYKKLLFLILSWSLGDATHNEGLQRYRSIHIHTYIHVNEKKRNRQASNILHTKLTWENKQETNNRPSCNHLISSISLYPSLHVLYSALHRDMRTHTSTNYPTHNTTAPPTHPLSLPLSPQIPKKYIYNQWNQWNQ
ncbi:unnamed protein product [Periconia digitata]|uniref:Uncharacterized protein n=1 Tax=Periconia digitata TaxID=1303443 RepID=A0A9W4XGC3_9PLEO|nr:unnamed protein product [Periconia digitata]